MKAIVHGVDAPRMPCLQFDLPLFKLGKLMGVRRQACWLAPKRPNADYRIVIVNDIPDIVELEAHVLSRWGFTVAACAFDGVQALSVIRRAKPDLVLINYQMPGLDGVEVVKRLRADPETSAVKIILDSGWSKVKERALAAGADEFLPLPIKLVEFRLAVTRVLRA